MRSIRTLHAGVCLVLISAPLIPGLAQTSIDSSSAGSAAWRPYLLGTQVNVIAQSLRSMRSPYEDANSLTGRGDFAVSHAYGVYAGIDPGHGAQAYLDVEMVRGKGIGRVVGLAGPTNGDVLRQGTTDLGSGPYVARAFLRYTRELSGKHRDTLTASPDQIPTVVAAHRVEITAGKLAVSDLFDVNRYANSTRQQFLNWSLFQNTAWDFAADTRGYSNGIAVAWIHPGWAIRAGSFQMPRQANGNVFDSNLRRARGDQVELTLLLPGAQTVARILGYVNHARMGNYAEALLVGRSTGQPPDIAADDQPGRRKYGYGLNLEQPVADGDETGIFARLGWNDGANESFAFTEVDRHASVGVQVSGAHWRRKDDHFGLAGARTGVAQVHRDYLGAGGLGFLLGDGKLRYGSEELIETYYRAQVGRPLQVSPDIQLIRNPGYNRDRGPALVGSLRLNFRF
jgi:high affinity Mn2+ porin